MFNYTHYWTYTHLPTVASGPTGMEVKQEDPTSVRVSWIPPSPPGHTTGYTILYSTGERADTREISGAGVSEARLAGLVVGGEYSISLLANSQHLPSETVTVTLQLVLGK